MELQTNNERKLKITTDLLKLMGFDIDTIEIEQWNKIVKVIHNFKYVELIRPLILKDEKEGKSIRQMSIKYNITHSQVRTILKR